jgi:hypothetical protein
MLNLKQRKKMKKSAKNQQKLADTLIQNLSPFKKLIAEALNAGEYYWALEVRLARERNIPLASAKAYVTMVFNYLAKNNCLKKH